MSDPVEEGAAPAGGGGFRRWRRTRPFWAGLFAMIAGAIVAYVPSTGMRFLMMPGTLLWMGLLVGALMVFLGLFLWIQPELRFLFGVLIILLSFASFVTSDFGGFFIGLLLGLVAGSLAVSWTPKKPVQPAGPEPVAAPVRAEAGGQAEVIPSGAAGVEAASAPGEPQTVTPIPAGEQGGSARPAKPGGG